MNKADKRFHVFLRKTFDLRPGEFLRAIFMQLYIFLVISTLLIVKPTVNGLFLSKFGVEKLPYAFILVALVAGLVTTIYSRLVRNLPLNKVINGNLVFSVISLIIFGIFLRFDFLESIVLYIFYIWVAIFALLTTSQFWILANIVFNAREAKRLFGFIGAGAIAGGIFGGYFTSVVAQFMGSEFLPFWAAFFLSLCIPINLIVWHKHVAHRQSALQQKKRLSVIGDHPFTLLRKSRHLTFIATIVCVSVMVAKLVDYQYGGIAADLIEDPDELTSFFGFWLSTFSVISLCMQLFVTRRVVGTYGVGSSLLFLPVVILLAVLALILFPGLLATAVFLKMSDSGLKQSVNKAAMELLILPIPTEVKNQTKTFIDVFIDSLATGISGVILIFLVSGLDLSNNAINAMIIGLLLLWFYLISQVRREYLISFRKKIEPPYNHIDNKEIDFSKESVLNGIKRVLAEGSDYQKLEVLKKIKGMTHKRLLEPAKNLLHHSSDTIKAEALRYLYYYNKPNLETEVEYISKHDNQDVQMAAFEYMVKHAKDNRVAVMEKYLHQKDYKIRGAALVSLASEIRDNSKLIERFKLSDRIQSKLDILPSIYDKQELQFRSIIALQAIGHANLPQYFDFILKSLSNKNLKIAKQAIIAAGNTLDATFIIPLINCLSKPHLRSSSREALTNYGVGIVDIIEQLINNNKIAKEELTQIPSVIKKIGVQKSVDLLFFLEENQNISTQYQAIRGLNYAKNNFPHLKYSSKKVNNLVERKIDEYKDLLSVAYTQNKIIDNTKNNNGEKEFEAREVLVNLLIKRLKRKLECIFRILALKHTNGDIYIIYKGIMNNKADMQTNALEFLDNLLIPKVKKKLIPLIESAIHPSFSAGSLVSAPFDTYEDYQCFQILLNKNDTRITLNVLYLLKQIDDERYNYLIKEQSNSTNEKIKTFATKIEENILLSSNDQLPKS